MEQANNVTQFLEILKRYGGYSEVFYRGQSSKYKDTFPSIARDEGYLASESSIYKEAIHMRQIEFNDLRYPIEFLSKMQHYGIPARLIDVTVDPLIALYFAVENVENEFFGIVNVYIQKSYEFNSKQVNLLALLASLGDYSYNAISDAYKSQYSSIVTQNDIMKIVQESIFLKYSEELKRSNSRLYNQKGTFVICGNEISVGKILHKVKPLDSIKPTMSICIPFEHKLAVKRELDERYGINQPMIYPELPSVAGYIKEKYKRENFSIDGTYSVIDVKKNDNRSIGGSVSIAIVLNEPLRIDQIKMAAIEVMSKYKSKNHVIWIYVARNGDDYIMSNWILRGQWISDRIDSRLRPFPIGPIDEHGHIWKEEKSYSTLADYYATSAFDDDKNLYVYNSKIYKEVRPIYRKLLSSFESNSIDDFIKEIINYRGQIHKANMALANFGHSRNKEFDDFLEVFQMAISSIDDIFIWANRSDLSYTQLKYMFSKCFKDAEKYINIIEKDLGRWGILLSITDDNYNKVDPYNIPKHEYQFEQTIPLNPNGLMVDFNMSLCINEDKTISISGDTNLFDEAELLLSISTNTGLLMGQSISKVINGKFDFGTFSINDMGYKPGNYKAEISLSIPSVQPEEFTKRAGIEYENLSGPFVDRTGIGPTIRFEKEFIIPN